MQTRPIRFLTEMSNEADFWVLLHWVTLSFRNTKVLHQTTGLTPN